MKHQLPKNVVDLPELRDKVGTFQDRAHAGEILASMLEAYEKSDAVVMAIPAGGVPVAKVLAEQLNLSLDIAVVSKITLPWNTEVGYGAVAFDGTVRLNNDLVARIGLTQEEIEQGIKQTSSKVAYRVSKLRGELALPNLSANELILVDDGLASGFTMQVAAAALRKASAGRIIVAVPTGHYHSVNRAASEVEKLYCANIRSGWSFAVADAYKRWVDVGEDEVAAILVPPLEKKRPFN
jgi:putative phosphoribosyl transferase